MGLSVINVCVKKRHDCACEDHSCLFIKPFTDSVSLKQMLLSVILSLKVTVVNPCMYIVYASGSQLVGRDVKVGHGTICG